MSIAAWTPPGAARSRRSLAAAPGRECLRMMKFHYFS
jgi:hypothetical protein